MPKGHATPAAVRHLARVLSEPQPMRRGTFSVQYLKCNKPGCACAERPAARHGPYYRVVRVVGGQTRSRHVAATHADVLRQQVEAGQTFRTQVDAFWDACEQWADAQLDTPEATAHEAAKQGASTGRSQPRSSPRSKRS